MVVALSVAVLIVALSLSNGFEKILIDKLVVAAPHVTLMGDYESAVIPPDVSLSDDLNIAQVQSLIINPDSRQVQGVLVRGTATKEIPKLFKSKDVLIEGRFPEEGEAIIGKKLAENSDLSIGDEVKVLTGPAISTQFTVSGIFVVGLYDFDSGVIIASYDDIKTLTPEPGEGVAAEVSLFRSLCLNNPMEAKQLAERIMALNPDLAVSNWQDDNKSLISAIEVEKKVIFIVLLLLIVSASVAIANSQFIQMVLQQEQIAMLSAVGFAGRKILFTFLFEGFFIGIVGSIIGFFIALGIVFYLSTSPVALPMDVYQVNNVPVSLEYRDVIITILSAVLMVWLSSLVPAFYASRLDPVEVLRRV